MRRYKIRIGQYCSLSKEPKFQQWLLDNNPELLGELTEHLVKSTSCKSNVSKMMEIQTKLLKSGKLEALIEFLQKEYPIALIEVKEEPGSMIISREKIGLVEDKGTRILSAINNSRVFKYYNPSIMTFPQKLVMQNSDVVQLEIDVKEFVSSKFGSDYVIVDDLAFIEYFKPKFRNEVGKISKEKREIFLYKAMNKSLAKI